MDTINIPATMTTEAFKALDPDKDIMEELEEGREEIRIKKRKVPNDD